MADGAHRDDGPQASPISRQRAILEIAIAYVVILAVIWTPRPLQRFLWLVAVATVATMLCLSFPSLNSMGLRTKNFLRSLWVVGAALAMAAVAVSVASAMHTLRLPDPPPGGLAPHDGLPPMLILFIQTYWGYALWTFVQQFLMQCFFLPRMLRVLPSPTSAAFATAALFALAHLPNPILAPVTLLWGFAACLIFLRYRNLYPLGMAHAIFGIALAITIPGPVLHNMRVGLGYLRYGHTHSTIHSPQPQGPDRIH